MAASTLLAAGDSATHRAPVLASRSLSSPASRSTSSHRSVRTSFRRHPVSISSRNAANPLGDTLPSASSSLRTLPRRRNSCSDRNRSQLRFSYFFTNRHGFPPSGTTPHASAMVNSRERVSTT